MRRFTIYLNEDLAAQLQSHAEGNVSAYVAALLEWEFQRLKFSEAVDLLRQLPADPNEQPLTDRASILRAVEEMRHPVAAEDPGGDAPPRKQRRAAPGS